MSDATPLSGVFPIAPTPFTADGDLDLDGQRRVLDCMIDQGVDGICILANYSEQFLLSDDERDTLLDLCLTHVRGRVPVIVTCSHFSTRIAAARARAAVSAGAAMLMLMPPYHGAGLRADEAAMLQHFARVAEAAPVPLMIQDAPLSGVTLSVPFLVRLAREVPTVRYFKIEVPGAAAKLRSLIAAGGDAIEGPFDGEESITLLADLDAGATGTMPSALLPDLIKPVLGTSSRGPAQRSRGGVRAHPAADQLREPAVRVARDQDGDGSRRCHSKRRGAPSARAAAPGDPRRPARARCRGESAGAALGKMKVTSRHGDEPDVTVRCRPWRPARECVGRARDEAAPARSSGSTGSSRCR